MKILSLSINMTKQIHVHDYEDGQYIVQMTLIFDEKKLSSDLAHGHLFHKYVLPALFKL